MTATGAKVALIACGAVAQDTAALVKRHGWDADVHGISSDLHMTPLEIAPAVEEKLQALLPRYERVIVVYGDCGTGGRLDKVLARYPAVRPAGVHCFQWYAGDLFKRFDEDYGIYFLTDWLVTNWDRAVIHGLGLDRHPWLRETYFGGYGGDATIPARPTAQSAHAVDALRILGHEPVLRADRDGAGGSHRVRPDLEGERGGLAEVATLAPAV
jgi:hypothetical protein